VEIYNKMNYTTFQDFLSCLYVPAKEMNYQPSRDEIFEGLMMIYSGETPDISVPSKEIATRTPQGVKVLGAGVIKVVHRCRDSKKTEDLDLSFCSLMQVPDAVFNLTKAIHIHSCNLSGNLLTKLCPKFGSCLRNITTLNLSNNRLSSLPSELIHCCQLKSVDVSGNTLVVLPPIILLIESVQDIKADRNFIADVDELEIELHPNLHFLDLRENPLTLSSHIRLSQIQEPKVVFTPRQQEDWEDLTI